MDLALSAADVVVSRAGGGVAELAAFGVPGRSGAAPHRPTGPSAGQCRSTWSGPGLRSSSTTRTATRDTSPSCWGPLIDDPERRSAMSAAMRAAAHLDAADAAARVVLEVADGL